MQTNVEKENESSTMQPKNYVEHNYRCIDYDSGTIAFIFRLYGKKVAKFTVIVGLRYLV